MTHWDTPDETMMTFEDFAREVFSGRRKSGYQKDLGIHIAFQNAEKGRSCWAEWCRDSNNPIQTKNVVWVWQDSPFAFLGLFVKMRGEGEYFDLNNPEDQVRKRRLEEKVRSWLSKR